MVLFILGIVWVVGLLSAFSLLKLFLWFDSAATDSFAVVTLHIFGVMAAIWVSIYVFFELGVL